jgi:pimeloyl-ACP methyl ester carboxylesterase
MTKARVSIAVGALLALTALPGCLGPHIARAAAAGLLHPMRRAAIGPTLPHCGESTIESDDVLLKGWQCATPLARRGTVVYLHGIADNRTSATGVIARYLDRGFDVAAFDARSHGASSGDVCTYGFREKQDLRRIVDGVPSGPVVLIGTSLGAAIVLQEAAGDSRITAVVAAESFSDLRTVARERAPWYLTESTIQQAFAIAEHDGRFHVDDVSPVRAAARLKIPVLLLHGADDHDTPAAHSERIFAALAGPKRLIVVPHGRHSQSLNAETWPQIDTWIDDALRRQ